MKINLQYGREGLDIDIPFSVVTVLRPRFVPGLEDEQLEFERACRSPIESPPLKDLINPTDQVAVVIPDGTRALPSDRLLSWLFNDLAHIPAKNFTVILGTGTHRPTTEEEILQLIGSEITNNYRVINHNAHEYSYNGRDRFDQRAGHATPHEYRIRSG